MPVNRKMMQSMKKQYGAKKGKSVYYATENKMKVKRKQYGSSVFSKEDEKRGYQVYCSADSLNTMDVDRVENVPAAYRLAERRESNTGGHATRKTFRRSESKKGSY